MSNAAKLAEEARKFSWFHSIDLGGGVVTHGAKSPEIHKQETAAIFGPLDVEGKTLLDIGAWNGFNSIEAKRRGARRVVAADHFVWHKPEFGLRRAIEIPLEATGLDVEVIDVDILDLTPESTGGPFDIVFFLGVFYHLEDPIDGLKRAARLAKEVLVVETHIEPAYVGSGIPSMVFYPNGFNNDTTNCWGPNPELIFALLQRFGFKKTDLTYGPRATFHAWR